MKLDKGELAPMPRASQASDIQPPGRLAATVVVAGGAVAVALLVVAGVLWLRYGTAVFFQTLAAGLAACF